MRTYITSVLCMALLCAANPTLYAAENPIVSLEQTGQAFANIAKAVSPAVVNIQSDQSGGENAEAYELEQPELSEIPPPFLELFKQLEPGTRRSPVIRQGSGFIISEDGYIVTNNHLVQNANKITVKLLNNDEYTAKIIGTDPQTDIAVIKIKAKDLPIVTMGDSDKIEVGEWVVALGNPFGLSHSLSAGILSAKGRSNIGLADYENFLQTDAAINPGNSGGTLIDLRGRVIGINTAIFSRSGGYMGIGFAIPINMAKTIIDQLIHKGSVTRGYLGVKIQPMNKDLAASFGLNDNKGILVAQVEPGAPADKAGILQGDVIVSLDGQPVVNIGDFRNNIATTSPNSTRKIGVLRNKKSLQLQATIGNLNNNVAANKVDKEEPQLFNKIGLSVQTITEEIAGKLGVKLGEGIVVSSVKPGSLADIAGLTRGSVILEVNREKVNDLKKFKSSVENAVKDKNLLLLVQDQQYGTRYVAIKLG